MLGVINKEQLLKVDDNGHLKVADNGHLKVDDEGHLVDVRVVNHVLNESKAILELKSAVYKVGDQVECRLEDDPTALSIFPSDRRIASMRNRWFKGSISAIHVEGNNILDDDAVEEYVIAVELRSNKLDDTLSSLSALFRRCLTLFLCLLCRKKRKEFSKVVACALIHISVHTRVRMSSGRCISTQNSTARNQLT